MTFAETFKRVDLLPIAAALAEHTHGDQDLFETTAGITTSGTRQKRASQLVTYLFTMRTDPDQSIIDLLDFMYFTSGSARTLQSSKKFAIVESKVLGPRGVIYDGNGFTLSGTPSTPKASPLTAEELMHNSTPSPTVEPPSTNRDSRKVFVVHGRDTEPLYQLELFLGFLNLSVMSWSDARSLTKKSQPTTYEIVKAGIDNAAAVLVIFSPDDTARLAHRLTPEGAEHEAPTGQPRQNVILEAGMALASAPDRTIIVRSGKIREISDISGFNYVTMDGDWSSREDLISRLKDAGASPEPRESNLNHRTAGEFKVPRVGDQ